MKKFFEEYFYIPKHGKIREKVMLMRVAMTVGIVLTCLVAMSITAYAYFSHDVTSGINVLKSAWFDAKITVSPENGSPAYSVTTENNVSTYKFDLGKYTITLEKKEGSTAETGFCIIHVGDKTYHTQQLGKDAAAAGQQRDSVSFILDVKAAGTIGIESHWGTSSYYDKYQALTEIPNYIVISDPLKVLTLESSVSEDQNVQNEDSTQQSQITDISTDTQSQDLQNADTGSSDTESEIIPDDTITDGTENPTDVFDSAVSDTGISQETEPLQP